MVIFSLASGVSQITLTGATMTTLSANVFKNFILGVFLNPGQNYIATGIVCVIIAAPLVGSAFLIKKLFEKYCPDRSV